MCDFYPGEKCLLKGLRISVTIADCLIEKTRNTPCRIVSLDSEKLKNVMSCKADRHSQFNYNAAGMKTESWQKLSAEEMRDRVREPRGGIILLEKWIKERAQTGEDGKWKGDKFNLCHGDAFGEICEDMRFYFTEGSHRGLLLWAERPAVLFAVPYTDCALLIERYGSNLTPEEAGYDLDDKAKEVFVGSVQQAQGLGNQRSGLILDHLMVEDPSPDPSMANPLPLSAPIVAPDKSSWWQNWWQKYLGQ